MVNFINPINANFLNPLIETKFERLVSVYGFQPPEFRQTVYEFNVEFRKGSNIISVYFDAWTLPFVELFRPVRKIEFRKIPLVQVSGNYDDVRGYLKLNSKMNESSVNQLLKYDIEAVKDQMARYMDEYFVVFEEQQSSFLAGNDANTAMCI